MDDKKVLENIAARLRHALLADDEGRGLRLAVLEIAREIENRLKQDEALRNQK